MLRCYQEVVLILAMFFRVSCSSDSDVIFCYLKLNDVGGANVKDLPLDRCSHLVLQHVTLNPFTWGTDELQLEQEEFLQTLRHTRSSRFPGLKVLLSLGGEEDSEASNKKYTRLVEDSSKRRQFAQASAAMLQRYDLQGLELDWRFPETPSERKGYSKLVQAVHQVFRQSLTKPLLAVKIPGDPETIAQSYDIDHISRYADFVNLEAFDFHGYWEHRAFHPAPLYPTSADPTPERTVDSVVRTLLKMGSPNRKILLGIPSHARTWALAMESHGLLAPAVGGGRPGEFTGESGILSMTETCGRVGNFLQINYVDRRRDISPFATAGDQWIGYDDQKTVLNKALYIKEHSLGGAFISDLLMDDPQGVCGFGPYPFLTALSQELDMVRHHPPEEDIEPGTTTPVSTTAEAEEANEVEDLVAETTTIPEKEESTTVSVASETSTTSITTTKTLNMHELHRTLYQRRRKPSRLIRPSEQDNEVRDHRRVETSTQRRPSTIERLRSRPRTIGTLSRRYQETAPPDQTTTEQASSTEASNKLPVRRPLARILRTNDPENAAKRNPSLIRRLHNLHESKNFVPVTMVRSQTRQKTTGKPHRTRSRFRQPSRTDRGRIHRGRSQDKTEEDSMEGVGVLGFFHAPPTEYETTESQQQDNILEVPTQQDIVVVPPTQQDITVISPTQQDLAVPRSRKQDPAAQEIRLQDPRNAAAIRGRQDLRKTPVIQIQQVLRKPTASRVQQGLLTPELPQIKIGSSRGDGLIQKVTLGEHRLQPTIDRRLLLHLTQRPNRGRTSSGRAQVPERTRGLTLRSPHVRPSLDQMNPESTVLLASGFPQPDPTMQAPPPPLIRSLAPAVPTFLPQRVKQKSTSYVYFHRGPPQQGFHRTFL